MLNRKESRWEAKTTQNPIRDWNVHKHSLDYNEQVGKPWIPSLGSTNLKTTSEYFYILMQSLGLPSQQLISPCKT